MFQFCNLTAILHLEYAFPVLSILFLIVLLIDTYPPDYSLYLLQSISLYNYIRSYSKDAWILTGS